MQLSPDDAHILDSMGWVLYRRGELEQARQYLQRAYDLRPEAEIAAHLGEVLWKMGRTEEARGSGVKARSREPNNETLQRNAGTAEHRALSLPPIGRRGRRHWPSRWRWRSPDVRRRARPLWRPARTHAPGQAASQPPGRWPATPPREERASGRFELRAAGDTTELDISSPFGQTLARARARPGLATIETADGRKHQAANPQLLTEEFLGWRVPIERLRDWLAGDFGQARSADGPGELRAVDSGWQILAQRWQDGRPLQLVLKWPFETVPGSWRRVEIRLAVDPGPQ